MTISDLIKRLRPEPEPVVRRRKPKRDLSQDDWLLAEEAAALLAGRAAGLGEKVHAHMLRHSYCTHLTLNGVPIEVVRVLAGHVSISTTQLYTAVPDARRFEAATMLDFSRHAA